MIFEWYTDCLKFIIHDLGPWTEDEEMVLFSFLFKISLSYCRSWTWMCILGVKWSHMKWYKHRYNVSMKWNGVKAKEILLRVTTESCSFLIYQLTFCVQNSCISNSPHKMSACSGTVSCQRTVSGSLYGGPELPFCRDIAPVMGHMQLVRVKVSKWTLNAIHNSALHTSPQNWTRRSIFFPQNLCTIVTK